MSDKKKVEVTPRDVVLVGSGSLLTGLLIATVSSYGQSRKSLIKEGIDPAAQRRLLPIAVATFTASIVITGCIGAAALYGIQQAGFVKEKAEIPPWEETLKIMQNPMTYWKSLHQEDLERSKSQP